jgi:hypothetical protein
MAAARIRLRIGVSMQSNYNTLGHKKGQMEDTPDLIDKNPPNTKGGRNNWGLLIGC